MGVINGQAVSAAITNAAFLNKNQADQMTFPVSFTKTLSLPRRDESSAATVNALDSSSSLVNVTATVTTINGAVAPSTYADGALLIIANSSSNNLTISHESASATAANRFTLPFSAPLIISAGQAAQFFYDSTAARWKQAGGTGSGTSGGGLKNYIANGSFETLGTSGWSLASSTLDATTKLPNQAAGSWGAAAGTLSFSTVTGGNQLAGTYSGSLVSSGATTAGNMLVTDALTLDQEAQASVQTWSVFYKVASGAANVNMSGTSSNSFGVAIYDVTNSAWIQPAGVFNFVQNSLVGKASGTFQVPSNCTSVRLALYFPNASSGAVTLTVDDFVLGPQVVQYGAPVTDWQSYTPTFTGFGTPSGVEAAWSRVGSDVLLRIKFISGTSTATEARVSLPSGLVSADTTRIPTIQVAGGGSAYNQNGNIIFFPLIEPSVSYLTLSHQTFGGSSFTKLTGSGALSSGQGVMFQARVPIQGWSSSVSMSNDTETRVVAAQAQNTASGSYSTSAPFNFSTVNFDTHGAITTGASWKYTAPVAGVYRISIAGNISASGAGTNVQIYKNGSATGPLLFDYPVANYRTSGTATISLVAGDYIDVRPASSITATPGNISVERISGPSAIAANETVAASYSASSALVVADNSAVLFDTKLLDSHGSYSVANGRITAVVSGTFEISANLYAGAANRAFTIFKNGSVFRGPAYALGATATGLVASLSTLVPMVAGDYLEVRNSSGSSATLAASNFTGATISNTNFFNFKRVGN